MSFDPVSYLMGKKAGGGSGVTVEPLSVSKNGTYTAETGKAYSPVSVSVQPDLQSKTVTPTTSQQTVTPDTGKDGLSSVIVTAISPVKAAQTYIPGTTDQTIASGRWLSGTQTIKGDVNLVPDNIKSGVTIFGKTGTYSGSGALFFYNSPVISRGTMYFAISEDKNGVHCDSLVGKYTTQDWGTWKNLEGGIRYTANGKLIGIYTDGIND